MDCWKETVLLSLQQDLSEITAVIWEMLDVVPNANFNSWLFPTKFCRDLLSIQMRNSADYTHHLEHILDRIYYVFNILLIHLQEDTSNAKKGISRPIKVTLGKCVLSVWKAVAVLVSKNKSKDKRLQSELELCHCSSQTDYVNSGNCDSCDVALVCLKSVSDSLERNLSSSRTSRARESLQANAFRVNLSNCMHSICEAIEDDVMRMAKENYAHYEQLSRMSGELSEAREKLASEGIAAMENREEIRKLKDFLAKDVYVKRNSGSRVCT
ncbi:PREDICTED: uncharacterized protein LOC108564817 [Nicrophorus vespilloides]|uniref:Uncharacterized protein LOC108564817 n=1 Tax=Nicrophorus vespilloides TaxID=110193 RepID=A0ABM1MY04_NICVS|nr:PREDICTED: uncharacterized protein LOC108564817 [Nicrophorus vespilloides]